MFKKTVKCLLKDLGISPQALETLFQTIFISLFPGPQKPTILQQRYLLHCDNETEEDLSSNEDLILGDESDHIEADELNYVFFGSSNEEDSDDDEWFR